MARKKKSKWLTAGWISTVIGILLIVWSRMVYQQPTFLGSVHSDIFGGGIILLIGGVALLFWNIRL